MTLFHHHFTIYWLNIYAFRQVVTLQRKVKHELLGSVQTHKWTVSLNVNSAKITCQNLLNQYRYIRSYSAVSLKSISLLFVYVRGAACNDMSRWGVSKLASVRRVFLTCGYSLLWRASRRWSLWVLLTGDNGKFAKRYGTFTQHFWWSNCGNRRQWFRESFIIIWGRQMTLMNRSLTSVFLSKNTHWL